MAKLFASETLQTVSRQAVQIFGGLGTTPEADVERYFREGMRATIGGGKEASHMPLDPKSTYNSLHELLDEAHRLANRSNPDPELDCPGGEPLWGHHSFRRFADTVARQTMAETGATEQDIDLTFGWLEAMYSQKMQIHYESKFVREKRKAVTSKV